MWDSGGTVMAVRERLRQAGARVAEVCVLRDKPGGTRICRSRSDRLPVTDADRRPEAP